MSWTRLREVLDLEMRMRGYRPGSRTLYRNSLLSFERGCRKSPSQVTATVVREYLAGIQRLGASPHWIATTIAALRLTFDLLGNASVTADLRTPRRPSRIPEVLSPEQVRALIQAAPTYRDRLLIGLIYGCGFRASELRALRWSDINPRRRLILIRLRPERKVPLPAALRSILVEGVRYSRPDHFVIVGARPDRPMSGRMMALVVRRAARAAGIDTPVTCLTLRYAHIAHALAAGSNPRQLQEALAFKHVAGILRHDSTAQRAGALRRGGLASSDFRTPSHFQGLRPPSFAARLGTASHGPYSPCRHKSGP